MAKKYQEPSEGTNKVFNQVIVATGLSQNLKVTVLVNNKAKKVCSIKKADDLVQFLSGDDVVIFVNEIIFDKLTEKQQRIVAEEALAYISYDSEKDKIVITGPDFVAHSGILRKYSFEAIEVVRESITTLYSTLKQEEEQNKQATTV